MAPPALLYDRTDSLFLFKKADIIETVLTRGRAGRNTVARNFQDLYYAKWSEVATGLNFKQWKYVIQVSAPAIDADPG